MSGMKRVWRISFLATASLATLLSLAGCGGDAPQIDIVLDRSSASSAEVKVSGDRAFILVGDYWGINGLTATLVDGRWPEEVLIDLRVRGLERLEIHYENFVITTGRSSNESPDPPLILHVIDENGEVSQAPPSANIYYPEITRLPDGFEISLPAHFFRVDPPSFSLQWIDFYRQ